MQTHQSQSQDWQGRILKRYRMRQFIGRGGMGIVWLADDLELRRQVAVKLLPPALAADQHYLQAFAQEARTAAALDHPQILPIHDFDEVRQNDGTIIPYLVMPYMPGGSLRDRLHASKRLMHVKESLHYLRQAAQAIDYAHSRQVLHRDIKPANILLQEQWLFLTDFGIAKILADSTHQSATRGGAGTPQYMAPEQARGRAEPASDQYSLAITAYQLFTGDLPFKGETPYAILMQQILRPLTPPQQINPAIPPATAEALTRALSKDPYERFPSCVAFVEALDQGWHSYLNLSSDPEATIVAPWSKRHPYNLQTVPYVSESSLPPSPVPGDSAPSTPPTHPFPSAPLSPVPTSYAQGLQSPPVQMDKQHVQASPEKARRSLNRRTLLIGGLAVASVGAVAAGFTLPMLLKSTTENKAPQPVPPGPHKIINGKPLLVLEGHSEQIWVATWDPSGRYLATSGEDTWVMLWDIQQALQKKSEKTQTIKAPLNKWKFSDQLFDNALAWSPDGRQLTVTPSSHIVYLIEPFKKNSKPEEYRDLYTEADAALKPRYSNVVWSPKGKQFVTNVSFESHMLLWQVGEKIKPVGKMSTTPDKVPLGFSEIDWSRDGTAIATLASNGKVLIWDVRLKKVSKEFDLPNRVDRSVMILRDALQWSPVDSNRLLATEIDIVTVWDVKNNKLLHSLGVDDPDPLTLPDPNPSGWVPHTNGVCWSPNGRYIAGSYGRTNKVYIWDTQDPKARMKDGLQMPFLTFGASGGHSNTLIDVAWSPDGRYLATTSFDNKVVVWQVDGAR